MIQHRHPVSWLIHHHPLERLADGPALRSKHSSTVSCGSPFCRDFHLSTTYLLISCCAWPFQAKLRAAVLFQHFLVLMGTQVLVRGKGLSHLYNILIVFIPVIFQLLPGLLPLSPCESHGFLLLLITHLSSVTAAHTYMGMEPSSGA